MDTPRSRGDRYALSALTKRRAILAAEIIQLERQARARKDALAHVDATLKLLDPDYDAKSIRPKRLVQRIRLFRQGELGRLIVGTLREADRPLSTADLVSAILAKGGHGKAARPTMAPRVRGNLAYQERRGMVRKTGSGSGVRWQIAE